MNDVGGQNAALGAAVVGACASCGKPAASSRVFCGHCGARLWDPCIDCGARNSVAERFCCQCGADLCQRLSAVQSDLDQRLARAHELEQEGHLLEAFQALEGAPEFEHSQLASRVSQVHRRRTELTNGRLQAIAERGTRLETARQLHNQRKYAEAHAVLLEIPASLRDQEARRLLDDVERPLAEIKRLRGLLAESLKNSQPDAGLGMAERLAELEPHAEDVCKVRDQLRLAKRQRDAVLAKKLLAKARQAVAANQYAVVRQCLQRMPPLENEKEQKLLTSIEERVWLDRQLRIQPYADKTLLRLAERLCKLQPTDENARRLHAEMEARLSRAENRAGAPFVPWGRPSESARLGAPVEPISNVPKIHWQADRAEIAAWVSNMRQFLVALGLALGGLGGAPLDDLLFKLGSSSWLSRLSPPRRRSKSAAWGLDFGTSGLKVVRLAQERDVITVDRACVIPYASATPRSEAAQIQPLIAPAFERFVHQCTPGDDPLVVNFPGVQSLGRFFTLPPMKRAQMEKAIEVEVATQIPLAVDEIIWRRRIWQPAAGKGEPAPIHVAIVAAKRAYVELRAGAFAEQDTAGKTLQSECVALLNVLLHCHADQIAQLAPNEAVALVEIGDSSVNIVAVAPSRGPWFRTLHGGIQLLNRPLVSSFGVTWQQADEVRRQWPGTRPMVTVDKALAPAIDELTRDVGQVLRSYCDSTGSRIVRIYAAGGGSNQYGLLREWSRRAASEQSEEDTKGGEARESESS
jgi:type IV pilus assembly protein PilM